MESILDLREDCHISQSKTTIILAIVEPKHTSQSILRQDAAPNTWESWKLLPPTESNVWNSRGILLYLHGMGPYNTTYAPNAGERVTELERIRIRIKLASWYRNSSFARRGEKMRRKIESVYSVHHSGLHDACLSVSIFSLWVSEKYISNLVKSIKSQQTDIWTNWVIEQSPNRYTRQESINLCSKVTWNLLHRASSPCS